VVCLATGFALRAGLKLLDKRNRVGYS
jgi:hypothetical protein